MSDQEGLKTAHKNVGTLELDPDVLTYCTVGGKKSKESCFLRGLSGICFLELIFTSGSGSSTLWLGSFLCK